MANRCFAKCDFFSRKVLQYEILPITSVSSCSQFCEWQNFVYHEMLKFRRKKIRKNHEILQDENRKSPNFISRRNYEKISRNLLRQGSGSRLIIKVFMNKFLSFIPPEQVETFRLKTPGLCSVNTLL